MRHDSRTAAPCKGQVPRPPTRPFAALPHDLADDHHLSGTAVRLAAVLLRYARDKPDCWPSVATLMAHLRRCRRTVQIALRSLEAAGWIRTAPADNPTGRVILLAWRLGGAAGGAIADAPGAQVPSPCPVSSVAPESEKTGDQQRPAAAGALTGGAPPPAGEKSKTPPVRTAEEARAHYAEWLELPPESPLRRIAEQRVREIASRKTLAGRPGYSGERGRQMTPRPTGTPPRPLWPAGGPSPMV
jgi:hypothetical protein